MSSAIQKYLPFQMLHKFSGVYKNRLKANLNFVIEKSQIEGDKSQSSNQSFSFIFKTIASKCTNLNKLLPKLKIHIICENFKEAN
mmetsp:Transcript_2033/g.1832  ORF Transcript_2033/g.1832 Transcript_2033/m.1832 type:complete len:85 (+) Transcript_2033:196-450(+)